MKSNISISVDERYNELIQSIREDAETKGQSFSFAILSLLEKATRPKMDSNLSLESDFNEIQNFCQMAKIEDLKEISHKSHILNLTCEAFIKWESYEGHRGKKQFPNPREANRYLGY